MVLLYIWKLLLLIRSYLYIFIVFRNRKNGCLFFLLYKPYPSIYFYIIPVLFSEIKIWVPDLDNSELPALWWDAISDKCLLLGVFKHGTKASTFFYIISSNNWEMCRVTLTSFFLVCHVFKDSEVANNLNVLMHSFRVWKVQHYPCGPCLVFCRARGPTRWEGHRCWTERQWLHGWVSSLFHSKSWKTSMMLLLQIKIFTFKITFRDVDDPEYKPAPALLKDDIEVR